ncbi:MFS transporter [Roseicella sp. DB1501]|uniref:MFS transporter n=1 Tax=Roseicella sp. DB1501 TaxID=2730925 RepID=UPI00149293E9|nr:MFS transporter [Roseicella sp. DB1501]NOG72127.1 MFS transporter [Roseicella sp. DB1501]
MRVGARVFFGWQVVAAAFVIAVCSWGINFYGPSVYLHALHAREGWAPSLISAAITLHFLASGALVTRLPALHRRYGLVAVTRAGMLACAAGALAWGHATAPWHMLPAALLTALGWALTSGVAINAMVAPWFDRRRGAALSMAFNGASLGGVLFTPLWALLIDAFGFAGASVGIALLVAAVSWPIAGRWLGRVPADLGLHPDGAASPPPPRPAAAPAGPLWRQARFRSLSLAFALGLVAQMGLLTTLFSILAPVLGEAGAGIAMSLATACAVIGRTVVGMALPPGLDRRLAGSANFLLQATGCALLAAAPQSGAALLAGVLLFGLGIGNLLSLPPLIAQVEWPAEQVTAVLALLTAVNQGFYAFGPALFGSALEAWGPAAPPGLALALQIAAAAVLLTGRRGLTARAGG